MNRRRLSPTVDATLLQEAHSPSAEVDASYAAYDERPIDEPDEWGDLASFTRSAARS